MRFACPETETGSFENELGLIAGACGQLFLSTLLNRGSALKYLFSVKMFDGPNCTRVWLFNPIFSRTKVLTTYMDTLAVHIALFPAAGLHQTKATLAVRNPTPTQFSTDRQALLQLAQSPAVQRNTMVAGCQHSQTDSAFERGLTDSALQLKRIDNICFEMNLLKRNKLQSSDCAPKLERKVYSA